MGKLTIKLNTLTVYKLKPIFMENISLGRTTISCKRLTMRKTIFCILLLVILADIFVGTAGFWRRRRSTVNHHEHHTHCNCGKRFVDTITLKSIDANNDDKIDKREAATILNLSEDYPGLDEMMLHADQKRDGDVDEEEFLSLLRDFAAREDEQRS